MTFDERVRALEMLGFSERQTRFLVTVALHSGFCLRRHYTTFAGLKYGAGVRDFLDRLVPRKLARRFDFRPDRGHVYHLHNPGIYDAIGQNDNRNRRHTSAALIARKLMLLDYVLSESTAEWYATEADKVCVFTTRFGLSPADLPQRVYLARRQGDANTTRYFIHKLPIGVAGNPPVVSLMFLVTDTSGDAFEHFLRDHRRFLNRLTHFRIVAAAPQHIPGLPACTAALRRFVAEVERPRAAEEISELEFYFTMRDQFERNDLPRLSSALIARWHDARRRFSAAEFEQLYPRWKEEGPLALEARDSAGLLAALRERRGEFVTHQLPIRYDRFGTRAGVS